MEIDIEQLAQQGVELATVYGLKLIFAILIFFIGKMIAKILVATIARAMEAKGVDQTVAQFVRNILYYALFFMICIAALAQLGVQTASFVAVVGAAGLAVGLALQGSLANFASGVLLILFRPMKVGDFVEAGGATGVVNDISIFSTTLLTSDNKTIIVSNSSIMGGNITNYSTQSERRVDLVVGVGYGANLDQVKKELQGLVDADARILTDKAVTIAVSELADSSVNLVLRPWVKKEDYWAVYFDLTENIKKRFDEVGIEIPFPQMDVHLNNTAA